MQTKLEEEKHGTSVSHSGSMTPKQAALLSRSSNGALRRKLSIEGVTTESTSTDGEELNHEKLLDRLTSIADHSDKMEERRQKFQRRTRDDWRTRTVPVTIEEIHEADSLETVNAFRALVRRKATTNMFDKMKEMDIRKVAPASKKAEFPQHLLPEKKRRSRQQRHKTLPVTAAELSSIPEGESLASESLRSKVEAFGQLDAKADSGILSGSDVDSLLDRESQASDSLRSLTLEMDTTDDDVSRLSVSAKTSIFRQMEEKTRVEKERYRSSASGAKRYIDRKKRERSRTQPVTEDEVKTASEITVEEKPQVHIPKREVVNRAKSEEPQDTSVEVEDELTQLSIADKVKLFSERKEEPEKPPPRQEGPVRRRPRRHASRFTQPVTTEEVEKAAAASRITPLMMSLVKPPDPEILSGLPLNAQRDLVMQHAEAFLSQPGSRSNSRPGSQPGSRRESMSETNLDELAAKEETKGILKVTDSTKDSQTTKGILKTEASCLSPDREIRSILKTDKDKRDLSEPKGILKKADSIELKHEDSETKGILKHPAEGAGVGTKFGTTDAVTGVKQSEVEPRGILKHSKSMDQEQDEATPRGILKQELMEGKSASDLKGVLRRDSHPEIAPAPPKGILKRESSFEVKKQEPDKSVLKKMDSLGSGEQNLRGILKKENSDETPENTEATKSSDDEDDGDEQVVEENEDVERDEEAGSVSTEVDTASEVPSRRHLRDRKGQSERYKTQPAEITPDTSQQPRKQKKYYEGRHMTQPITPEEMKEAEASSATPGMKPGGSISDRLNALKKSGEEDWRKRIGKSASCDTPVSLVEGVKMRDKSHLAAVRPSSIVDRLSQLETSKGTWKDRVETSDAVKFTVAGKINKTGGGVVESPLVARLKQTPKKSSSTGSSNESSPLTSPTTPTKETKIPIPKEIISAGPEVKTEEEEKEDKVEPVTVEVPQIDEKELEGFFTSKDVSEITEKIDVSIDDFNDLFIEADDILPSVRRIRPSRRQKTQHRNPLKTMSMFVEVKQEYTEVNRGVAEKELKRIKREKVAKDAGFAEAALAGLASKENFSKVELRKTEPTSSPIPGSSQRFDPFKELMLLHFKGRRNIQIRLVEPCASSMNSGDCYVLVTPDKVINWVGEFSNIIEKAKSAEVASYIHQKRDMGCRGTATLHTVEEQKQRLGAGKQFWSALGGQKEYQGVGPDDEDELFESALIKTNMVYLLKGNSLVPCEECWGCLPRYGMMKKDQVLVFDFGSELYVWQGKTVSMEKRKLGMKLAQQLWEKGYDYTACPINPVSPLRVEDAGGLPMAASSRPSWALFGKVNQNMETILFREKFADWPDSTRLIRVHSDSKSQSKQEFQDLKAYDAKLMIPVNKDPLTLCLEGTHVGRGLKWYEDMEGFIREFDILTLGVTVWHVLEYDHSILAEESYGQFHDGDTYVVRWQYMVSATGTRSRFSLTGRERCVYFFWQGKESTITEKGASALMTVELDEERGPQVRVVQSKEPPCFLNLFKGSMIVHIGKREDASTNTQGAWRLYSLRNQEEGEVCLLEITLCLDNLRSRSSFILLNVMTGVLYVWHGCKSWKNTRQLAAEAAQKIKTNRPQELGLNKDAEVIITEMKEGDEASEVWSALGSRRRTKYLSLRSDFRSFDHTIRLFHMTSVSGQFEVLEQLNSSRVPGAETPFPFLQSDLYKASQPALFLVDAFHEVYLWQGWWPVGSEEQENVRTGSAHARFDVDRKCAMETTLHYCREKRPDDPLPAYLVYAGVEPLEFTNLFPFWSVDTEARSINLKEGRNCEMVSVKDLLDKLTMTRYTLAELQVQPLPEGVNPLQLETYLEDNEFETIFEMTKSEFYELPTWKQRSLKQQVGLF